MATDRPLGPWPDVAIPPGEFLAETLQAMGLSQTDVATRADRPVQAINEIIQGKKAITPETAITLARVLGTPAHVWLNLERDYRYNTARLEDLARLREEAPHLSEYPYGEMAKHGWVPNVRDRLQRVRELLTFFGVASLDRVRVVEAVAYRRAAGAKVSAGALAAWLRRGELEAQALETGAYDEPALRQDLRCIRGLTRERIEVGFPRARERLARHGVAVVCVPHLKGTYAHGATRWVRPDRAMVQLSIRYRYDDIFWFSLFHEVGHILLHRKKAVFVETDQMPKSAEEEQADRFAADLLIPPAEFQVLRRRAPYSGATVYECAQRFGVASSIVVGRLHHEGLLGRKYLNKLRSRLDLRPQP